MAEHHPIQKWHYTTNKGYSSRQQIYTVHLHLKMNLPPNENIPFYSSRYQIYWYTDDE